MVVDRVVSQSNSQSNGALVLKIWPQSSQAEHLRQPVPHTWGEINVFTNSPHDLYGPTWSTCATHVGWNQCFHEFSIRFIRTNLVNLCHTRGVKSMFSRILHTIYTDQLGQPVPHTWGEINVFTNSPYDLYGPTWSTCATHVGWNQCFHELSRQFIRTNLVNLCHMRRVKSMFSRILHTIYTDQLGQPVPHTWGEINVFTNSPYDLYGPTWLTCATHVGWNQWFSRILHTILYGPTWSTCATQRGVKSMFSRILHTIYTDQLGPTCATRVEWNQCFYEFSIQLIRTKFVNLCHTREVKSLFSRTLQTIQTDREGGELRVGSNRMIHCLYVLLLLMWHMYVYLCVCIIHC